MSRLSRLISVPLIVFCVLATSDEITYRGPDEPVPAEYFGMHIHHAADGASWPEVPFVGWRLWDAGVAWPQLEPERGKWDFNLLDKYIHIASERHTDILLTLGLTPQWASSRPQERSAYGRGNAAEPLSISDWEDYIRVVATRYKGVIHNYEVWNEPTLTETFTGTVPVMVQLARSAYQVLKSVDPSITVVSPAATADQGVSWLERYLHDGGCEYSDVIGYHLYVTPDSPEAMVHLIQKVRHVIQKYDCAGEALWNTESGWSAPKHFDNDREAASFLMRTYLLNWLLGVQRCYWYAWDNHKWSTLDLTSRFDNQMTGAGAAYGVVHRWMLGAVLRSCNRTHSGLWTCYLVTQGATKRILWSDAASLHFEVPPTWQVQRVWLWNGEADRPSPTITVDGTPILLDSR